MLPSCNSSVSATRRFTANTFSSTTGNLAQSKDFCFDNSFVWHDSDWESESSLSTTDSYDNDDGEEVQFRKTFQFRKDISRNEEEDDEEEIQYITKTVNATNLNETYENSLIETAEINNKLTIEQYNNNNDYDDDDDERKELQKIRGKKKIIRIPDQPDREEIIVTEDIETSQIHEQEEWERVTQKYWEENKASQVDYSSNALVFNSNEPQQHSSNDVESYINSGVGNSGRKNTIQRAECLTFARLGRSNNSQLGSSNHEYDQLMVTKTIDSQNQRQFSSMNENLQLNDYQRNTRNSARNQTNEVIEQETTQNTTTTTTTNINTNVNTNFSSSTSNTMNVTLQMVQGHNQTNHYIINFAFARNLKDYLEFVISPRRLSSKQVARLVVDQVNYVRLESKDFQPGIQGRLERIKKLSWLGDVVLINKEPDLPSVKLEEGKKAVNECLNFINNVSHLSALSISVALLRAAEERLNEILTQGWKTTRQLPERIEHYGIWSGLIAESVWQGFTNDPIEIVIDMLIGDGDKKRLNRTQLLHESFRYIGVAFGVHYEFGNICVIYFASEIAPKTGVSFQLEDDIKFYISQEDTHKRILGDSEVSSYEIVNPFGDDNTNPSSNQGELQQTSNRSVTTVTRLLEAIVHSHKIGARFESRGGKVCVQQMEFECCLPPQGVNIGDELVQINGNSVAGMKYDEILKLLKQPNRPIKLTFKTIKKL